MQAYTGFAPKAYSNRPEALPAGVYEAVIKGARVENTQYGQRLIIALDVTSGEHAGHYQKMFDYDTANGNFTPKWKGTYRQAVPTGDGTERDGWKKNSFEGMIWAIEESNPGYHWNWDENTLKGLRVGINVRNKEWDYNDMTGWTTEIGRLESIKEVAAGTVKVMKDKPLNNSQVVTPAADSQSGFTPVETDALPF